MNKEKSECEAVLAIEGPKVGFPVPAYDKRVDGFSKERGDFSSVDHVFVRIFLFYGLVGIRRLNPVSASC